MSWDTIRICDNIAIALRDSGIWEYKTVHGEQKLFASIVKVESKTEVTKYIACIHHMEYERKIESTCPLMCMTQMLQAICRRETDLNKKRSHIERFQEEIGYSKLSL
jgi:hypothetical protein